jgi:ubiquinone/menaquinone biosynthesis C-methylase UbiE
MKQFKRIQVFVLLLIILFQIPAIAQDHRHQRFGPEIYERPGRDEYQKPDEVVKALNLKPGDVVADIGAGSGYFTRRLAPQVLPGGLVYAVDIDERMLQYIHQEVEKRNLHNIVTVLSPAHDPMLAPVSVDMIFICNTYHHFTNRQDYNKRLVRALKKGGRLVIVDYYKKDMPVGPPPAEKLTKDEVIRELTAAGLKVKQDLNILPYQYFLIFQLLER